MDDHVIDCCSLINLHAGWGGLNELRDFHRTWHICAAVLNEAEFTREFGPDGAPLMVPLDMNALTQLGLWLPARPETEQEIEAYVNFATEVDDGEAQALAVILHHHPRRVPDQPRFQADPAANGISLRPLRRPSRPYIR